jgi:hypothetical protein
VRATSYPEFAQGFSEHKLLPSVVKGLSVELLYLQCVLKVHPRVVCVVHAHTQANADRLVNGQQPEAHNCPVDVLLIAPLTFQQVTDVMGHMARHADPPPPEDGAKRQWRAPVVLGPGADYRKVCSRRMLIIGSEELAGCRMNAEDILRVPDVVMGIDEISDQIPAHFLSICDARKVIPVFEAAQMQRDTATYFTEAPDGGFNFDLDQRHEELGVRCLAAIPQAKLFQSSDRPGENANMLLNYVFPSRSPPDTDLRNAVGRVLQLRGVDLRAMGNHPTNAFIYGGRTLKQEQAAGGGCHLPDHLMCHDPTLNNPLEDRMADYSLISGDLNATITENNYPMLSRTSKLYRQLLGECTDPHNRADRFCQLFTSAYRTFEASGGAGLPKSIYGLMLEGNVVASRMDEYRKREPDNYKFIDNLWTMQGTGMPLRNFDTLATLAAQLFHLGSRAFGLMSTQLPAWMVLSMSLLGGIIYNTNKKLRFGMLGTPDSGKSFIANVLRKGLPKALTADEGDSSELAKVHEGSDNDCTTAIRDEVAERADDAVSMSKRSSRGFRNELMEMEDGYSISKTALPQSHADGSTTIETVKSMSAKRTIEVNCLNSIMKTDNPYYSRVTVLRIADPSRTESHRAKMAALSHSAEQVPATLFTRMVASLQLVSCLPSHFGLDAAGTDTQLLHIFCALLETVGGKLSPYGRNLGKLTNHLVNITSMRLAAEAVRFKAARPGSADRMTRAEQALQCVVNNVSSPADVLAAYASFNSCGVSTAEVHNALLEALVGLLQLKMVPNQDENGKLEFAGFQRNGAHYVLQQMGPGNRQGEEVTKLMERVHSIIRTIIPTSTPSKPDVKGALDDLGQRYVNGVAALTVKEWKDPDTPEDRGNPRWCVAKELLIQTRLGRHRALCRGIQALVAKLLNDTGYVYYSEDKTCWRIPKENYADVALTPTEYKNDPDREVQRIARMILLPCNVKPDDDVAAEHMLDADKASVFFRLGEQLKLFEFQTFNRNSAFIEVDPEQTSDGSGLQAVDIKHGCLDINIELCKSYAAVAASSENSALIEVAKAFQAITLPAESFTNQHTMYLGQETMDNDMAKLRTVPLHDPAGYAVETIDWMYRKTTEQCDSIIGPPLGHRGGAIMPGTAPKITYRHGDALYDRLLKHHAEALKMPADYITRWHVPGWVPPGS